MDAPSNTRIDEWINEYFISVSADIPGYDCKPLNTRSKNMLMLRTGKQILQFQESKLPSLIKILQNLVQDIKSQDLRCQILRCLLSATLKNALQRLDGLWQVNGTATEEDRSFLKTLLQFEEPFLYRLAKWEQDELQLQLSSFELLILERYKEVRNVYNSEGAKEACIAEFNEMVRAVTEELGSGFLEQIAETVAKDVKKRGSSKIPTRSMTKNQNRERELKMKSETSKANEGLSEEIWQPSRNSHPAEHSVCAVQLEKGQKAKHVSSNRRRSSLRSSAKEARKYLSHLNSDADVNMRRKKGELNGGIIDSNVVVDQHGKLPDELNRHQRRLIRFYGKTLKKWGNTLLSSKQKVSTRIGGISKSAKVHKRGKQRCKDEDISTSCNERRTVSVLEGEREFDPSRETLQPENLVRPLGVCKRKRPIKSKDIGPNGDPSIIISRHVEESRSFGSSEFKCKAILNERKDSFRSRTTGLTAVSPCFKIKLAKHKKRKKRRRKKFAKLNAGTAREDGTVCDRIAQMMPDNQKEKHATDCLDKRYELLGLSCKNAVNDVGLGSVNAKNGGKSFDYLSENEDCPNQVISKNLPDASSFASKVPGIVVYSNTANHSGEKRNVKRQTDARDDELESLGQIGVNESSRAAKNRFDGKYKRCCSNEADYRSVIDASKGLPTATNQYLKAGSGCSAFNSIEHENSNSGMVYTSLDPKGSDYERSLLLKAGTNADMAASDSLCHEEEEGTKIGKVVSKSRLEECSVDNANASVDMIQGNDKSMTELAREKCSRTYSSIPRVSHEDEIRRSGAAVEHVFGTAARSILSSIERVSSENGHHGHDVTRKRYCMETNNDDFPDRTTQMLQEISIKLLKLDSVLKDIRSSDAMERFSGREVSPAENSRFSSPTVDDRKEEAFCIVSSDSGDRFSCLDNKKGKIFHGKVSITDGFSSCFDKDDLAIAVDNVGKSSEKLRNDMLFSPAEGGSVSYKAAQKDSIGIRIKNPRKKSRKIATNEKLKKKPILSCVT